MIHYYCESCGELSNPASEARRSHVNFIQHYWRTLQKLGTTQVYMETHILELNGDMPVHPCRKCWEKVLKAHVEELKGLQRSS